MNNFNICPSCIHKDSCVLTNQKDMVWSCSEFDENTINNHLVKPIQKPKRVLELV
ncbi:hypothetical protein [Lacinutrix salivirga]